MALTALFVCLFLPSEQEQQLWIDLKSGAESGWDFTSRWYIDGGGHNNGSLRDTRTSQILPVDLNALLCRNEKTLAWFHRALGEKQPLTLGAALACSAPNGRYITVMCRFSTGDNDSAARYDEAAARRLKAVEAVLWDAERGAWFDYSLVTHSKHFGFYMSNLAPIWAKCYSQSEMEGKALQYLKVRGCSHLVLIHILTQSITIHTQVWFYIKRNNKKSGFTDKTQGNSRKINKY